MLLTSSIHFTNTNSWKTSVHCTRTKSHWLGTFALKYDPRNKCCYDCKAEGIAVTFLLCYKIEYLLQLHFFNRQHFHPGLEKVSNSLLLQDTVAVRQGVVLPLLYHIIYEGWALVFSPVHHISHIIHPSLLINRSSIMPTYYKLSGGYPTLHHRSVTIVSTTGFAQIVPSLLFGCFYLH